MTITAIDQSPPVLSPAYNENMYLATSSGTAQTDFRYIFDVYASDGSTRLARVKLPARPADNRGLFDAKRIIENYLSYDLPTAQENAGLYKNSSSFYKYIVKVGEEYEIGGTLTQFLAQQTIAAKYIWNSSLEWIEFIDYVYSDYILALLVTGGRFLTEKPLTQNIEANQNAWLSFITLSSGAVTHGCFKKYNSSGSQLGTLNIANPNDPINEDSDRFLRLACGTANIEAHSAGWIDSDVSYYTAQVLGTSSATVSQVHRFDITDNCQFTTVRLHWLNKLGGWDSFNFTLKSSESVAITKQQYKKRYGSDSGASWSYSSHERGDVVFDASSKQRFKINSDWISEAESNWLLDLFDSPEVYLEYSVSRLAGINILNKDYQKKKKVNQKLFNIELEFEYSFEKTRQRG
jgi:hypothetical protein